MVIQKRKLVALLLAIALTVSSLVFAPIYAMAHEVPFEAIDLSSDITTVTGLTTFILDSVSWNPASSQFTGGIAYEVTIVLQADTGYTFAGILATDTTIEGEQAIILGSPGNMLTISRTFPATATIDTLITASVLTGVTSPAVLEMPSATINSGTGFTAEIAWNHGNTAFGFDTQYTATVTLTAQAGFTFFGGFNNTSEIAGFSIAGNMPTAWISNSGTSLVFEVQFPATGPAPTFQLTVSSGTNGMVSGTSSGMLAEGSPVDVTATANSGFHFVDWTVSGATITGGITVNPAIFSMPGNNVTISARFEPDTIDSVTVSPSIIQVERGMSQQFTATVAVTGTSAKTVTWSVTGGTGSNTISSDGNLNVDPNETDGATLTITATSTVNTNVLGTATVTVTDTTPTPVYGIALDTSGAHTFPQAVEGYGAQGGLTIAVSNAGNQPTGTLSVSVTDPTVFTLSNTSIGSISNSGSDIFTIAPAIGLASNTYTATVTVSSSLHGFSESFNVSFLVTAIPTFTVTVNGSEAGLTGAGNFASGDTVTIYAGTRSGFIFNGWTSTPAVTFADANNETTRFVMLNESVTVTANWTAVGPVLHAVTVVGSHAGTTGAGNFAQGTAVSINAGTRAGYTFAGWTSSPPVSFANANNVTTSFVMPNQAVTITANWTPIYTDGGTGTDNGSGSEIGTDGGYASWGDDEGEAPSGISPMSSQQPARRPLPTPRPPQATAPIPTPAPPMAAPVQAPTLPTLPVLGNSVVRSLNGAAMRFIFEAGVSATLVFPGAEITFPSESLATLVDAHAVGNAVVHVEFAMASGNEDDDHILAAGIVIAVGDVVVDETAADFTIAISLSDLDLEGMNPYRIVAVFEDGTLAGGRFDTETGLFIFETRATGTFAIIYSEYLRRLIVHLDSNEIIDMAYNAPTQIMDVLPVIVEGRALLPVRFVAYALGAEVDWAPATYNAPLTVTLTIGDENLVFGVGEMVRGMDVPSQIIDGRTMVPLRFISESMGAVVNWDGDARSVEIIKLY